MAIVIDGFEDLVATLRHWSAKEEEQYDFVGVVRLFSACADNLRQYGLEAELEDLGLCLETEQIEFLIRLGGLLQHYSHEVDE